MAADDNTFKFIKDNVDKKVGVHNEQWGHHGKMEHMFSILAAHSYRLLPFPSVAPDRRSLM